MDSVLCDNVIEVNVFEDVTFRFKSMNDDDQSAASEQVGFSRLTVIEVTWMTS